MKKVIALAIVSVLVAPSAFAYTVNLEQMQKEAICQSNAAALSAECKKPVQTVQIKKCVADLTDEQTGKRERVDFELHPDNIISTAGGVFTYHVEDSDGSVTAYLNKSNKGTVSVMDGNTVTYSGNINCK